MPDESFRVERLFRPERPSRGNENVAPVQPADEAAWIWRAGCDVFASRFCDTAPTSGSLAREPQAFLRFRRDFEAAPGGEALELDVSADERFVLLLDGAEIGRGPNRGLPARWHLHAYRVEGLAPGAHRLEAVCWQIGAHAPLAQLSVRGGFLLKASGAYDGALTTGRAPWLVAPLAGTRMTDKGRSDTFGAGSECEVRGMSVLDEEPPAGAWEEAAVVRGPVGGRYGIRKPGWLLFPTPLPDMMLRRATPGAFRPGPLPRVVPARSRVESLWDLGDYYCAYPELRVSGGRGARVRWDWAECLVGPDGRKGDRAAWEGLGMRRPFGDSFLPDGRAGARFTTPWWRCGRWCRLVVETGDEPLAVEGVALLETRLPAEPEASFACDDPLVAAVQPLCVRTLQMCLHEMFFDCPYYEQQMYPGDTRVQILVAGLFRNGGRAVRNALALYDADRRENGQMPMNAPTRGTQESFTFTCCQAAMVGDFAWNRADPAALRALLPGLCQTLLGAEAFLGPDGLLVRTPGWNFVDWVPDWPDGVPPDGGTDRPNAEINLQFLHAVLSGVRAAEALGETRLAARWRERAAALRAAIRRAFWRADRALFASDAARARFSRHAQALALLADVPEGGDADRCFEALVSAPGLDRESIYFRHYLFATFFKRRRPDLFLAGLDFWRDCLDLHCPTVLEIPDPAASRSDCHAWGSHPLWHLHAGVAGVRPDAPFYARALVDPQPGPLRFVRSVTPTPRGPVKLDLRFDGPRVAGSVELPPGLPGTFRWAGRDRPLAPGRNEIG